MPASKAEQVLAAIKALLGTVPDAAGAGRRHQGRFAPAVPVACGDP
jgi:hypothetical protein